MTSAILRKKLVFGLLTILSASLVLAEDEIVLAVSEGTVSLSDALSSAGSSLTALNGGADAAKTIRKTGAGTLTFTTKLPNWSGDLYVDGGVAWVSGQDAAVGNADAGEVYVADGATIVIDAAIASVDSSGPKRPIHVQGTGAPGEKGAIRSRIGTSGNFLRGCLPFNLVLDGDTTWAFDRPSSGSGAVFDTERTIDMNGHVLTLTNEGTTDPKATCVYFDSGMGALSDQHAIIVSGMEVVLRGAKFGGDETCTFTLTNGSFFTYSTARRPRGFDWKLVVDETADPYTFRASDYAGAEFNNWCGPVELDLDVSFTRSVDAGKTIDFTFLGKVSGAHSIYGGAKASNRIGDRNYRIGFGADGNDFTGGIALTNATLAIRSARALSSVVGGISLVNASVEGINTNLCGILQGTVERQELPSMTIDPRRSANDVATLSGSEDAPFAFFRNTGTLTKTGAGTLEISASVTGGTLDIREGRVKIARPSTEYRGLIAGYVDKADGTVGYTQGIDRKPYTGFKTNEIVRVPDIFNPSDSSTIVGPERVYKSYRGYIWNHGDEPVSYTFACAIHCFYELNIGDTQVRNPTLKTLAEGGNDGTVTTVTLPPGPTPFSFRYGAQYGSTPNCNAVATNNLSANWPTDWFLVYDPQGRGSHDVADYQVISNDCEKPLFTYLLPGEASNVDLSSSFDVIRGEAGTTLDLDGGVLGAGAVEGGVSVVNGTLLLPSTGSVDHMTLSTAPWKLTGREGVAGLYTGKEKMTSSFYSTDFFKDRPEYGYAISNEVVRMPVTCYSSIEYPVFDTNKYEYGSEEARNAASAIDPFFRDYTQNYVPVSGYLWCNSPTAETWTVIFTGNFCMRLKIGDNDELAANLIDPRYAGKGDGENGHPPDYRAKGTIGSVVVQPGANAFFLRNFHRWNAPSCWVGNTMTFDAEGNPFANWQPDYGLVFDRQGRGTTDGANYEKFVDPGDGSLFTFSDVTLSVGDMSCDGAAVDLCWIPVSVADLDGTLSASNGTVLVTDTWTLTKAQIESDAAVATGVDFAVGVTFKIADDAQLARKSAGGYYVLARAADFTAVPTLDSAYPDAARWSIQKVAVEGGCELRLVRAKRGIVVIYR